MQYENKILISAILIIAIALVSFNAIGPNIGGKVTAGNVKCGVGELKAEIDGAWTKVTYLEQPEPYAGVDYNGIDKKFVEYWTGNERKQQSIPYAEIQKQEVTVFIRNPRGEPTPERVAVWDKCLGNKIYADVE